MRHHPVLRVVGKLIIPFILLFALYVQFHGDFGPGGGFQAGVIFASGFILYALIFGMDAARVVAPPGLIQSIFAIGLLIYIAVGVAAILLGGNFLDYSVLSHDPVAGQHRGILLIEFGVGVTVASVLIAIFFAFADRRG